MLLKKLGKYATVLGAIALATKLYKGAVETGVTASEKFEAAMDGAKGAVEGFFATLRTGDFTHLIGNMIEAGKAAKRLSEEMQDYERVRKAESVSDIDVNARKAELMVAMRSESKTFEERIQAYHEYVKAVKDDVGQELAVEEAHLKKLTDIAGKRAELNKQRFTERFGTVTPERAEAMIRLPETNLEDIKKFEEEWVKMRNILNENINPDENNVNAYVKEARERLK